MAALETPVHRLNVPQNGLTCIRSRIHCTATNPGASKYGETDLIMIDNFLETLANAAMAVAARRPNDEDEE